MACYLIQHTIKPKITRLQTEARTFIFWSPSFSRNGKLHSELKYKMDLKLKYGVGETAWQLRELTVCIEVPGLVPSMHVLANNHL